MFSMTKNTEKKNVQQMKIISDFLFSKTENRMFSDNIFQLFYIVFTYFLITILRNNYTNI